MTFETSTKFSFCGHKPGVSRAQLKSEILKALENVPNELNKRFEYVDTNEQPFTINFTGIARKNVLIDDAQNAIKAALEDNLVVIRHHLVYYYRVMMILSNVMHR